MLSALVEQVSPSASENRKSLGLELAQPFACSTGTSPGLLQGWGRRVHLFGKNLN